MKKSELKLLEILNNIPKDIFYNYYITENHSVDQCCEYFCLTKSYFYKLLNFYNIKKPKSISCEISKNTKLSKYGNENYNNREKSKATCLVKYGFDNPFKDTEKIKNSYLNNLGVNHPMHREDIVQKVFSKRDESEIQKKRKETCLKKYNVTNFTKSDEYKKLYLDSNFVCDTNNKRYVTKKNNNSFHISNKEDLYYEYLLTLYDEDDIIRQYKSEEYPFACDFYIVSENRYIECNFNWTHGGKPYIPEDIQCIQQLNIWQEKANNGSEYYKNAIYTWTDLDVRKRKIAERNNINIEFLY